MSYIVKMRIFFDLKNNYFSIFDVNYLKAYKAPAIVSSGETLKYLKHIFVNFIKDFAWIKK